MNVYVVMKQSDCGEPEAVGAFTSEIEAEQAKEYGLSLTGDAEVAWWIDEGVPLDSPESTRAIIDVLCDDADA